MLQLGLRADDRPGAAPLLSLDAAIQRALKNSPALQVNEVEVDRRQGLLEQTSGSFDWITSGSIVREKVRTPAFDSFGRDTVSDADNTSYTVATTRKLRNGVVIQPSADVSVVEPGSSASSAYGTSRLSLQIVVPLLRGLGRESAGASEAAARGDVEVGRLLYRHALSEHAYNTAAAYWQARAADAATAVRRDDELRAKKLHEGIKVLVNARVFAPNLLLQSEANLLEKSTATRSAELDAQSARFTLASVIGLPLAELVDAPVPTNPLPETAAVLADAVPSERLRWVERALNRRSDYLASRQSQVPLRLLTRQAEIDLKPQIDLNVRGGYAGLDTGSNLVSPLSRRLTGANGQVGLSIEWPGSNTYQRGLLRSRRASERQALLTTAQMQINVAADVCLALEEVRLRSQMMRDAAATAEIARKAVEQEQRKLQTGEATVLDVINLESMLSSARLSKIDAQSGYAIAVARLRFAIGEIFTSDKADHSFQLANLGELPADEK
jgi:outer membrane protein TolC